MNKDKNIDKLHEIRINIILVSYCDLEEHITSELSNVLK